MLIPTQTYTKPRTYTGLSPLAAGIAKLPYLDVSDIFTGRNNTKIHDVVIQVDGQRFLISGYYTKGGDVNATLQKLFSNFIWRGELVVVPLGLAKPFLKPTTVKYDLIRRAVIESV